MDTERVQPDDDESVAEPLLGDVEPEIAGSGDLGLHVSEERLGYRLVVVRLNALGIHR